MPGPSFASNAPTTVGAFADPQTPSESVADLLGVTPPAPDPGASKPSAPTQKGPSAQDRINQLTAQKHEALRALDAIRSENTQFRIELESIRKELEALRPRPESEAATLETMPQAQLYQLAAKAAEEGDQNIHLRIMDEISRRHAEKSGQNVRESIERKLRDESRLNEMWQRVLMEFGPDAQKEDSPLFQVAQRLAAHYVEKEGQDFFKRNPYQIRSVYLEADRMLRQKEFQTHKEELDRLRAQEKERQMAEGLFAARTAQDNVVTEALQKGDRKTAARLKAASILGLRPPSGASPS